MYFSHFLIVFLSIFNYISLTFELVFQKCDGGGNSWLGQSGFFSLSNCISFPFQLHFCDFWIVFLSLFNCVSLNFLLYFCHFPIVFLSLLNCISLNFQWSFSHGIICIFPILWMKCISRTSYVCVEVNCLSERLMAVAIQNWLILENWILHTL